MSNFKDLSEKDLTKLAKLLDHGSPSGDHMKGKIRPISRQTRCPKCGDKFKEFPKLGYFCLECQTVPNRFLIDLPWKGNRYPICSDNHGAALDSYNRALTLNAHIQYEIDNHIFEPTKYKKADKKKFLFENQISQFLKDKEIEETKGNIAPSYLDSLKNYIYNYYIHFFRGMDVREIHAVDIKNFYHQLPKRKEKTQKNILDTLRHFFKMLHTYDVIIKVPVFPKIRVPEAVHHWISFENQMKLLNAIPEEHRPIFTFDLFQGVRPSEARALKWKDIKIDERVVIIQRTYSKSKLVERTKGRNVKPRMIHPLVLEMLYELPHGFPDGFVFVNPSTNRPYSKTRLEDIFRKARQTTGIDINLYAAGRHSVATNAAMAGADPCAIRDYLGHADGRTTEKYTHLNVLVQKQIFEVHPTNAYLAW